ncbi:hypothetical protein M8818_002612 [Zalaria obscura]|uniref:Uncharacterized protein n=1 Tax=Zalaria obscura TaxID=2024903 RepID=A0ACC3SGT1_9PEZI
MESCTVIDIPGKGAGLIATHPIARGHTIIRESPLVDIELPTNQYRRDWFNKPENHANAKPEADSTRSTALRLLPPRDYAPRNSDLTTENLALVWSRVQTNNFALDANGKWHVLIFDAISRANHSCLPNAIFSFNDADKLGQLRTLRAIDAGDEIVIDYARGGTFRAREGRRADLGRDYGFTCECVACHIPHALNDKGREWADRQEGWRIEFGDLSKMLGLQRQQRPGESGEFHPGCIDALHRCATLLNDIGYEDDWLGEVYIGIAKCLAARGWLEQAKTYAEQAVKVLRVCFGNDDSVLEQGISPVPSDSYAQLFDQDHQVHGDPGPHGEAEVNVYHWLDSFPGIKPIADYKIEIRISGNTAFVRKNPVGHAGASVKGSIGVRMAC